MQMCVLYICITVRAYAHMHAYIRTYVCRGLPSRGPPGGLVSRDAELRLSYNTKHIVFMSFYLTHQNPVANVRLRKYWCHKSTSSAITWRHATASSAQLTLSSILSTNISHNCRFSLKEYVFPTRLCMNPVCIPHGIPET